MTEPLEPGTDPRNIPEAVVSAGKRHHNISVVWLVPVVAAVIGLWLAYRAISEQGPEITISFERAVGLAAGKTKIKYKDVDVGEVTDITISEDLSKVIVTAALEPGMEPYLTDKSRFWVVRARVDVGRISGLGTLLSGAYIAVDPDKDGEPVSAFAGLEKPPVITTFESGRFFVLQSPTLRSINTESPIFFRGISVGRVVEHKLDDDGEEVNIKVFIESPYDERVRKNTRFWNASGISVTLDDRGIRVRTEGLVAVLSGGIAFDTPPEIEPTGPAPEDTVFWLHGSREDIEEPSYQHKKTFLLRFDGSVRGLSHGSAVELRGLKIGRVTHVGLDYDKNTMEFRTTTLIDVELDRLVALAGDIPRTHKGRPLIEALVKRGFRARLRSGSLLTGAMYIDFDFHSTAPPAAVAYHGEIIEVPTLPSITEGIGRALAGLATKLGEIPLDKIGSDLRNALAGVNRLVNSPDMKHMFTSLRKTMSELEPLVTQLNTSAAPALAATLQHIERITAGAESMVGESSPLRSELREAIGQLSKAARSLRALVDYLERHPEALLKGKSK